MGADRANADDRAGKIIGEACMRVCDLVHRYRPVTGMAGTFSHDGDTLTIQIRPASQIVKDLGAPAPVGSRAHTKLIGITAAERDLMRSVN